jgi:DNA-binding SARP family transcriptional activator/tetratricopeptide (TPR) repeat protein
MCQVEFRLLGPVEFRVGGRPVELGQPRQRLVLAALLVDAGQPVGWDTLIDRVWSQDAPAGARGALRAYVARLRGLLAAAGADGAVQLGRGAGGYRLDVDADRVDLHRFDGLVERAAGQPAGARLASLGEALAMWRGEPLYGLRGDWVERMRESWDQRRLAALIEWGRAGVECDPTSVVGPLTEAVHRHPLAESLVAVLMRALAATGQPSRALALGAATRERLGRELGTDPGPELREVHLALLRGEPEPPAAGGPAAADVVPAQLPADVAAFVGRADALARLDTWVAGSEGRPSRAMVISAVSGMGGVGKTALAVRWAHRVAGRFPDGQLYLNLRGFDQSGQVVPVAEAVRVLLDALGVAPDGVPSTLDAQIGLYRSLMAGRRILVVLDNARDAEQVRPLLPGTATAVVVVTSRNRLTSLVAADGADPVSVDVLPFGEARELLARRLGPDRLAAEPAAVEAIIAACAGLPLALNIVAARVHQSGFPLAVVADELGEDRQRLDALDAGDPTAQVRAVFSWSYATLSRPAARLFRLVGLHSGPDVSRAAAASLAGHRVDQVRGPLTELTRASLVTEAAPGRYVMHDLVHAYAGDLARTTEGTDGSRAALTRLLDYYAHSAYAADLAVNPARGPMPYPLRPPAGGVHPERPAGIGAATAWLDTELRVLIAALRHAADCGFDAHCWQLAWSLDTYFHRQGDRNDQAAVWAVALRAAGRLGDPVMRAYAHRGVAHAMIRLGHPADAETHLRRALDLAEQAGHRVAQAMINHSFAHLRAQRGEIRAALAHTERAFALHRAAGSRRGEGVSRNGMAWYRAQLGDYEPALEHGERAVAVLREVGDHDTEAAAWDTLGFIRHRLGHLDAAVECYRQSLGLYRRYRDRYLEADIMTHLAETLHERGDADAARSTWQQALDILTELDHPGAEALRARLATEYAP